MQGSLVSSRVFVAIALQLCVIPFCTAVSARAAKDSDSFASSLWGAFLFSILGLAAFVAFLIFLIKFVCERGRPSQPRTAKPPKDKKQKSVSTEHLVSNKAPAISSFKQNPADFNIPSPGPYGIDNSALASPYPQYNQPEAAYHNQALYSPTASSAPYVTSAISQFVPPSQESIYEPSSISPTMLANFPVPAGYNNSVDKSEYSATSDEEPFQYLEKYQPYSAVDNGAVEQAHMDELPTKRAVLRDSTPYQVIEERVQGEDYDDQDAFVSAGPSLAPGTGTKLASSGSFNDGKNRMVRVLPTQFHHPTFDQPPPPGFSNMGFSHHPQQPSNNHQERFF